MFAQENPLNLDAGVDIMLPEDIFDDEITGTREPLKETENSSVVEAPGEEPDKVLETKEGEKPHEDDDDVSDDKKDESVKSKSEKGEPEMIEFKEDVILKRLGESFKELGVEISVPAQGELTAKQFAELFTESIVTKQVSDPESELFKKVKEHLFESNGIDDRILSMAAGIPFGVNREEYIQLYDLKDITEQEGVFTMENKDSLKDLFETYHSISGQQGSSLEEYIQIDMDNATPDLIEKRRKAVLDYANNELDRIDKEVKSRKDLVLKQKSEKTKMINSFVEKGEVAGYSFSNEQFLEFFDAALKRNQEIELPDGSKRVVSALEKKRIEFEKENYEQALLSDMLFYFDIEDKGKKKKEDSRSKESQGGFIKNLTEDMRKYSVNDGISKEKNVHDPNAVQLDSSIFE